MAWFAELTAGRQAGYSEPCATSWAEMQAWQALQGLQLEPWQAQVLRRLDQLWLTAWRAGQETRTTNQAD